MADFNAGVTPADVAPGVEDTPGSGAGWRGASQRGRESKRLRPPGTCSDNPGDNRPGDTGATWASSFPTTSAIRRASMRGRRAAVAGALLTCGGRDDD